MAPASKQVRVVFYGDERLSVRAMNTLYKNGWEPVGTFYYENDNTEYILAAKSDSHSVWVSIPGECKKLGEGTALKCGKYWNEYNAITQGIK